MVGGTGHGSLQLGPIDLRLVTTYILNLVGPLDQCTKILWVRHDVVAAPQGFRVVLGEISFRTEVENRQLSKEFGGHGAMWMVCDEA